MAFMNDTQILEQFFPEYGVVWSNFTLGRAHMPDPRLAGVYVFTTFGGKLQSNWSDASWGDAISPQIDEARGAMPPADIAGLSRGQVKGFEDKFYTSYIAEQILGQDDAPPTVLYVGRSTAEPLTTRLTAYTFPSASCQPVMKALLQDHGDKIFVRWSSGYHWETCLINQLDPRFNKKQSKPEIDMLSVSHDWSGKKKWSHYMSDTNIGEVSTGPGLYVFTTSAEGMQSGPDHVYYVGEAGNIQQRMKTYKKVTKGTAAARTPFDRFLQASQSGDDIYLRWVDNFIFENEIIRILKPVLNKSSTSFS